MKRFIFSATLFACVLSGHSQFTPGNIIVSRVGDGTTPLTSSIRVELVEYTTAGVPTGIVVTLPFVSGGAGNRACTNQATATTEGALTLSYDGRYLVHVGYDAPEGVANPQNSASDYNRTVARVDAAGTVNTSTSFSANPTDGIAFGRSNIRAAYSLDGSQFWASGTSSAVGAYNNTGGVRYINFGSDNIPGVQVSTTVTNTRNISVFNDQLYVSSGSAPYRVATVGTGTPTTAGQTITNLPASIPTVLTQPVGFIFFDRDAAVSGPDLLYFVSQTGTPNEFGLFKYSFDGTAWTSQGKLADATSNDSQATGLTGYLDCNGNVVLYLTRAANSTSVPAEIRTYTDNAAYNATMTGNGTSILSASSLLVSAGANYAFRGICMAPAQGYTVTGVQAIAAGNYNVITVKSGGTATLGGNITVYDRIIVESGGTLDMGNYVISSPSGIASRFEVRSGGNIKIGHADGIMAAAPMGNVQTCLRSYSNSANYEYNGTSVQSTGDGLPTNISGTLKINNTAGAATTGVSLFQPTTVSGTLDLTSGKLTTTSVFLITVADNAIVSNAGINSFVNGPVSKIGDDAFIFPVGTGSIYAPIGISGGAGAAATDEFTAEYIRSNPQGVYGTAYASGINHISYVEHWTLDRNAGTASKVVALDVHQTSFCLVPATTFVSRWDGAQWTNEASAPTGFAACGSYQCGTITTNAAITNFSPFTLATSDPFHINPLPIKLIRFDAVKRTNSSSLISWELAECCSKNARFEIQKSGDGRSFEAMEEVAGSETSRFYNAADNRLGKGITYYRLKVLDENGIVKYSNTVAIINDSKGLLITSLVPNPVQRNTTITLSAARKGSAGFEVYDISGNRIKTWTSGIDEGNNHITVSLADLPAGVYHLIAFTQESRSVFRFVKQ